MIVDTGLHYTGMKRDEAIKMFVDHAWDDSDFTRKEVQLIYWQDNVLPKLAKRVSAFWHSSKQLSSNLRVQSGQAIGGNNPRNNCNKTHFGTNSLIIFKVVNVNPEGF